MYSVLATSVCIDSLILYIRNFCQYFLLDAVLQSVAITCVDVFDVQYNYVVSL